MDRFFSAAAQNNNIHTVADFQLSQLAAQLYYFIDLFTVELENDIAGTQACLLYTSDAADEP